MQASPIRVFLADDHQMLLGLLQAAINNQPDMYVIGTQTEGDIARKTTVAEVPDVSLLDADVSDTGVFDLVDDLHHRFPKIKCVLLTGSASDALIENALRVNVWGHLLKSETSDFVINCLRNVHANQRCFSDAILNRIAFDGHSNRFVMRASNALSALTKRQIEILRHVAAGETVKEISQNLHLSPKSIDSHKYRIMAKLGVRNSVNLARLAIREGLVRP